MYLSSASGTMKRLIFGSLYIKLHPKTTTEKFDYFKNVVVGVTGRIKQSED